MKALLLNGSPRLNGNTKQCLKSIKEGLEMNQHQVEIVNVAALKLTGCVNCDKCKRNKGLCVLNDESTILNQKILDADFVLFASPVYWWGITAQLKMVVDKLYAKADQLKLTKKKIGILAIGASEITDEQYQLIHRQFECIADYLNWEVCFKEAISAYELRDVADNENLKVELLTKAKQL